MFTPETLDFLATNRFMNSREWFAEHKPEFKQYVMQPMVELVEALTPTLERIDARIVTEPKVDKTISRIYRDMRRAHGTFYREVMWLTFKRDKHMFPGYPEFFFVFSPTEFFYGCGHYAPSGETMTCLRQMILDDHPLFRKADKVYRSEETYTLYGDPYKRSRFPQESARKREWLDRRAVCLVREESGFDRLFSPTLAEEMAADFDRMSPLYHLLIAAEQAANELRTD